MSSKENLLKQSSVSVDWYGIFHGRRVNNKINHLQKVTLQVVYNDNDS